MSKNIPMIKCNTEQMDLLSKFLVQYPEETKKVIKSSLQHTKNYAKNEIIRQIPKIYAIDSMVDSKGKEKLLLDLEKKKKFVKLQNDNYQSISLEVVGERMLLSRFLHFPVVPLVGKYRAEQFAKVKNANGMKKISPQKGADGKFKKVFLAKNTSPSPSVPYLYLHRTGKRKDPTKKKETTKALYTVAIPQMVTNAKVTDELTKNISERLQKKIYDELENKLGVWTRTMKP